MQNENFVSRPFHALSNGALVFDVNKSNILYRKIDITSRGNWASIQPPFLAYRTPLTGKASPQFERA
jgi:hypothetical protein